MEKFTKIKSKVVPVAIKNVDTDMILPAIYMTSVSRHGYGEHLFKRLRDRLPDFSFNQKKFDGAKILVADENFGCGSSREHAVWALTGWGLKVVIAKSFADIFHGNSGKNGLLLVTLPAEVVDRILLNSESGDFEVSVDLESQRVTLATGESHSFEYDPFVKHCLLNGLDDIDYINSYETQIQQFRKAHESETFCKRIE